MAEVLDHVLKLADVDDSVYAKWLKANRSRLAQIAFDWSFWRRPDQAEPEGNWRCWLLLAGRGFGKTRTGAEWVRARAEADGRLRGTGPVMPAPLPSGRRVVGATWTPLMDFRFGSAQQVFHCATLGGVGPQILPPPVCESVASRLLGHGAPPFPRLRAAQWSTPSAARGSPN